MLRLSGNITTKESFIEKELAGEGEQATEEIRDCQTTDTYLLAR